MKCVTCEYSKGVYGTILEHTIVLLMQRAHILTTAIVNAGAIYSANASPFDARFRDLHESELLFVCAAYIHSDTKEFIGCHKSVSWDDNRNQFCVS